MSQTTTGTNSGENPVPPAVLASAGIEASATQAENEMKPDPASSLNTGGAELYTNITTTYKFKAPRKDKSGKPPTDALGQPIPARAPVTLTYPVPTWEAVAQFVRSDEKHKVWLLDVLQDVVKNTVKEQVYDDSSPLNEQNELKINQLTLDYLSTIPKAERTGRGIAKEIWEAWAEDYKSVMIGIGQREAIKIGNAADALVKKFNPVRTNRKLVEFLRNELNIWADATQNFDDYIEIFEFLKGRANDIINQDAATQMDSFQ